MRIDLNLSNWLVCRRLFSSLIHLSSISSRSSQYTDKSRVSCHYCAVCRSGSALMGSSASVDVLKACLLGCFGWLRVTSSHLSQNRVRSCWFFLSLVVEWVCVCVNHAAPVEADGADFPHTSPKPSLLCSDWPSRGLALALIGCRVCVGGWGLQGLKQEMNKRLCAEKGVVLWDIPLSIGLRTVRAFKIKQK